MHPDILVVGGGFAGLSAGVECAEKGARVLILEKRSILGGRASSFTDAKTKESVDNGQHLFMGCYHHTLRFLEKIGARPKVEFQKNLSVTYLEPNGKKSFLSCPALPAPLHLVAGFLRFQPLTFTEKISILMAGNRLARHTHGEKGLVSEWLSSERQSTASIKYFWEPLVLATL